MEDNQLVVVPDWNPNNIKYIQNLCVYKNGEILIEDEQKPFYDFVGFNLSFNTLKKLKKRLTILYSKYIFKNYYYKSRKGTGYSTYVEFYDPLDYLKNLIEKNDSLNFDRFITEKQEKFSFMYPIIGGKINHQKQHLFFENIPLDLDKIEGKVLEDNEMVHFSITIDYIEIREAIISYIEQKIEGERERLDELKKLFNQTNTLSFDDYLNEKSKSLLELDLSDYISKLNKETDEKKEKLNHV